MYEFKDTTIQSCEEYKERPVSAMNFNGVFLEDLIEGYQTLSVDGREMINQELLTDNLKNGTRISSKRLPPRILTIKYKLVNNNPYELLNDYRILMRYLITDEEVDIVFNDELDVFYKGVYHSSETVPGDTTSIVSSFQIHCDNPFKQTVKTFNTDGYIGIDTHYDTYPLKITCTVNSGKQLKITNNKQTIALRSNTIKSGDVIVFDFIKSKVFVNRKDSTNYLELTSDFEYFKLYQGGKVETNNGYLSIEYKGVTL